MKGALCTRPGTFELREIETPSPAPGDVVVRVRSCGICGSDLHYFNGAFRLPSPPGLAEASTNSSRT